MAKAKTCSKCSEPRIDGQSLCSVHYAEYMREYRSTVKPMKQRDAHQEGFREGVAMCMKFLREVIGGRCLTGYQSALSIDKAMIGAESPEVAQRRAMIEALR